MKERICSIFPAYGGLGMGWAPKVSGPPPGSFLSPLLTVPGAVGLHRHILKTKIDEAAGGDGRSFRPYGGIGGGVLVGSSIQLRKRVGEKALRIAAPAHCPVRRSLWVHIWKQARLSAGSGFQGDHSF